MSANQVLYIYIIPHRCTSPSDPAVRRTHSTYTHTRPRKLCSLFENSVRLLYCLPRKCAHAAESRSLWDSRHWGGNREFSGRLVVDFAQSLEIAVHTSIRRTVSSPLYILLIIAHYYIDTYYNSGNISCLSTTAALRILLALLSNNYMASTYWVIITIISVRVRIYLQYNKQYIYIFIIITSRDVDGTI
jgi:hypothetical protein